MGSDVDLTELHPGSWMLLEGKGGDPRRERDRTPIAEQIEQERVARAKRAEQPSNLDHVDGGVLIQVREHVAREHPGALGGGRGRDGSNRQTPFGRRRGPELKPHVASSRKCAARHGPVVL